MTLGRQFTASMIGHLKGAPLSCLMLLIISGQPQPAEYLQRYSRYSDKVVNQALLFLQDEGLITRNARYSWQLSKYASQLPLMAQTEGNLPAGGDEACDPTLMTLTGKEPVAGADPESNIEDSGESENLRLGISDSLARVFNLEESQSINSSNKILASDPEILRLLFETLDRYGIREPARSRLARTEGMTVERIEYHCKTCPTGQAIWRIEHNWAIKKTEVRNDPDDPANRRRYIEGEYADFIEH
jgi:hypothetical protein